MNVFYNSFEEHKFNDINVLVRYIRIVCNQFLIKNKVPVNDIIIAHHDDDFINGFATIVFKNIPNKKDCTFTNLLKY